MTLWNGLRRSPIGAKKRAMVRTEEGSYPTFEHLLRLHRLDFWHNYNAQRSQPGWPDYTIFGVMWIAFVELKAVQVSGRVGKLSVAQERYRKVIETAGGIYRVFTLPTDWTALEEWLIGHTGIEVRGWAARQTAASGLVAS